MGCVYIVVKFNYFCEVGDCLIGMIGVVVKDVVVEMGFCIGWVDLNG